VFGLCTNITRENNIHTNIHTSQYVNKFAKGKEKILQQQPTANGRGVNFCPVRQLRPYRDKHKANNDTNAQEAKMYQQLITKKTKTQTVKTRHLVRIVSSLISKNKSWLRKLSLASTIYSLPLPAILVFTYFIEFLVYTTTNKQTNKKAR